LITKKNKLIFLKKVMEKDPKKCKTCNKKSPKEMLIKNYWFLFFGTYIFGASIYGTVKIVEIIYNYLIKFF